MYKALYCKTCGARLTGQMRIVSGKDPAAVVPTPQDRAPIMPRGVAFKAWESTPWIHREPGEPLSFVPQYWLNPDDLTDAVQLSNKMTRLNGCCGIAGIDGPNQLCRCKQEVGTLQDDCMTPRVFIPEPEATEWVGYDGNDLDFP